MNTNSVMKQALKWSSFGTIIAALAVVIGCEVSPIEEAYVSVTPTSAKLRKGESQEFVAEGAQYYAWSLSATNATATNQIFGVLDRVNGDRVIYTNIRTPSSSSNNAVNPIQVLTCVGRLGHGGTNSEAVFLAPVPVMITHRR